MLDALSRALRLSTDEREHLFRVAGQEPPGPGRMNRHLTLDCDVLAVHGADLQMIVYTAAPG